MPAATVRSPVQEVLAGDWRTAAPPAPMPRAPEIVRQPMPVAPTIPAARPAAFAPPPARPAPMPSVASALIAQPMPAPQPAVAQAAQPAVARGPSLFQRMTGVASRATAAAVAQPLPQPEPVAPPQPVVAPPVETAKPAEPKMRTRQPTLGGLDPTDRLNSARAEEDMLDIPAFLRRQAN
jgi:cell division protein FtsZ